jgi:hypothetical protein
MINIEELSEKDKGIPECYRKQNGPIITMIAMMDAVCGTARTKSARQYATVGCL